MNKLTLVLCAAFAAAAYSSARAEDLLAIHHIDLRGLPAAPVGSEGELNLDQMKIGNITGFCWLGQISVQAALERWHQRDPSVHIHREPSGAEPSGAVWGGNGSLIIADTVTARIFTYSPDGVTVCAKTFLYR